MFDAIATTTTCSSRCRTTTTAAGSAKYGSLTVRTARRRSLQSIATKAHEYESIEFTDIQHLAPMSQTQRSVSCFELGSATRGYRTIRIGKDSAELQQLAQANVTQLLEAATSPVKGGSNNALLARKALRYRHKWSAEAESRAASVLC